MIPVPAMELFLIPSGCPENNFNNYNNIMGLSFNNNCLVIPRQPLPTGWTLSYAMGIGIKVDFFLFFSFCVWLNMCMCVSFLSVNFYWRQIVTSSQSPVTLCMWHVTYAMWHVTHDMWQVTCDMWHLTCVVGCLQFNIFFYNSDKCKCKIPASKVAKLFNDSDFF